MATILLVDDDPLQGQVRKSILERQFAEVERVGDVAEAFIRVEDAEFSDSLGLIVVALSRPGLGGPAFVSELKSRLPWAPVLVLGRTHDETRSYRGNDIRFLSRSVPAAEFLACTRMIVERQLARPA